MNDPSGFVISGLVLRIAKSLAAVHLTKLWLFDLAGGIPGYICKDDPLWTLVSGQVHTELLNFFLGAFHALFDGNNSSCDLSQELKDRYHNYDDGRIRPPFVSIGGLGESAALALARGRGAGSRREAFAEGNVRFPAEIISWDAL